MLRKLIVLVVAAAGPLVALVCFLDDSRLSRQELAATRGGDTKNSKCPKRCDRFEGNYMACDSFNGSCAQCGSVLSGEFTPSQGHVINDPNNPDCDDTKGYRKDTQNSYACGQLWAGYCVEDDDSPTDWKCMLQTAQGPCTNTMNQILEQTGGPGGPGGGGD